MYFDYIFASSLYPSPYAFGNIPAFVYVSNTRQDMQEACPLVPSADHRLKGDVWGGVPMTKLTLGTNLNVSPA